MHRDLPFEPGDEIVWRSRHGADVGYVFGCRVVLDEPEVTAVVQTTGSPVVRPIAQRGGPNGRSFIPGTWDGSRETTTWNKLPVLRLHPIGRSYSVLRRWSSSNQRFHGWYVNLEQPWVRTSVGFDSRDDVLDVTVSDDLSTYQLKDADELAFAVEQGLFTPSEARAIHAAADAAIDDLVHRSGPFDAATWNRALDQALLEPTSLPAGWECL